MYYSGEPFMCTSIVMSVYISIYFHGTLSLEVYVSSSTRHSTQVVLTAELSGGDYMEKRTIQ